MCKDCIADAYVVCKDVTFVVRYQGCMPVARHIFFLQKTESENLAESFFVKDDGD